MPVLRRRAVDVEQELLVRLVHDLEGRPGFDVDHAPLADLVPLGRIAEIHGQRPADDDERLLLEHVPVPPALRARLVAPEVRPYVLKAGALAEGARVSVGLAGLGRARLPLELVGTDDAV